MSGWIYNAVITYVKVEHIAEEIVQDVFVRIWNNRLKLTEIKDVEDYVFILARNAAMDHFRQVTASQKLLSELYKATPQPRESITPRLMEKEYRAIHEKAVSLLAPQQQRVYRLAQDQEMPIADIAATMNLSRSTVKKHLELARRFVRDYVNSQVHYHVSVTAAAISVFFLSR